MEGNIWESLTEEQKQGVLLADIESENEDNLIDFEELKEKWSVPIIPNSDSSD
jgi:hypothetical protein